VKKREKYLNDYRGAMSEKAGIEREKEKIIGKIKSLQGKVEENRIKQGNEVERILKDEFDLRLYKIDYENYEVKMSRANTAHLASSELLNSHIDLENKDLHTFLTTFNGKINQYINQMVGYGETRSPDLKAALKDAPRDAALPRPAPDQLEVEQLLERYYGRRKGEAGLKNYLVEMLNLFKELRNSHHESKRIMEEYKGKFEKSSNSEGRGEGLVQTEFSAPRLHYYASSVNDQKILRMFETINRFEDSLTATAADYLDSQLRAIAALEEDAAPLAKELKRLHEDYRRRDEELKKARKKGRSDDERQLAEEAAALSLKICQLVRDYTESHEHKVPSYLIPLTRAMIESQEKYEQYATEVDAEEKYEYVLAYADSRTARRARRRTAGCRSTPPSSTSPPGTRATSSTTTPSSSRTASPSSARTAPTRPRVTAVLVRLAGQGQREAAAAEPEGGRTGGVQGGPPEVDGDGQQAAGRALQRMVQQRVLPRVRQGRTSRQSQPQEARGRRQPEPRVLQNHPEIEERPAHQGTPRPTQQIKVHTSEIYRCLFDLTLNFKGKIAVQIGTKLKIGSKPPLQIKLLIREFECPIRVCFTPFSLGKSYASLLERPRLVIDYSVTIGGHNLTKIPFVEPSLCSLRRSSRRTSFSSCARRCSGPRG
jgi:hypothetical protein